MNDFKESLKVTEDKKKEEKDKKEDDDRVKIFKELIRKYNEEAWYK